MNDMNFDQARFNMIEQQIRPWEVLDQRVLDTLAEMPREDFVPKRYRKLAFADIRIPLGHGETMMNPNVEGRILQAVQVSKADRVLEVGTGSGYFTACLAQLANDVVSVDIEEEFTAAAAIKLKACAIDNVSLQTGDAANDWSDDLFDVVVLTGSIPQITNAWRQRLSTGGRLLAIVGAAPVMEANLVTRIGPAEWLTESLFETEIAPLRNVTATVADEFTF